MEKHGLNVADIEAHVGGRKRGSARDAKSAVRAETYVAKYRDPKTGATWSGRGRAPGWIANVKDRTRFLVDAANSSPASAAASKGEVSWQLCSRTAGAEVPRPEDRCDMERARSGAGVACWREGPNAVPN